MKVFVGNKSVEADRVAFEPVEQPWTTCKLSDGTIIKLRLVVVDVVRLREVNPNGEPRYMVKSSNIVATEVPETRGEVH